MHGKPAHVVISAYSFHSLIALYSPFGTLTSNVLFFSPGKASVSVDNGSMTRLGLSLVFIQSDLVRVHIYLPMTWNVMNPVCLSVCVVPAAQENRGVFVPYLAEKKQKDIRYFSSLLFSSLLFSVVFEGKECMMRV